MIELAPGHKRGLGLANPVMNAAGTLGFSDESHGLVRLAALGAFVTNALTPGARSRAHPPNALVVGDTLLVHTGLPNPGLRPALRRYARIWSRLGPPVIVHLAAVRADEVGRCLELLETMPAVAGVELGLRDDVDERQLTEMVRAATGWLPLLVRLPLAQAEALCQAAVRAGADALTVSAPARASALAGERHVTGRLYGPAQFEPGLWTVSRVRELCPDTPLVGAGGIFSPAQARAYLSAGAAAIQVDGWAWQDPGAVERLTVEWRDELGTEIPNPKSEI